MGRGEPSPLPAAGLRACSESNSTSCGPNLQRPREARTLILAKSPAGLLTTDTYVYVGRDPPPPGPSPEADPVLFVANQPLHDVTDLVFADAGRSARFRRTVRGIVTAVADRRDAGFKLASSLLKRNFQKSAGSEAVAAFPHDSAEFHDNAATAK